MSHSRNDQGKGRLFRARRGRTRRRLLALVALLPLPAALGQGVFDSGSTGADGALVFYPPPSPVQVHAMVFDSVRNVVVLFGGDISGLSNQTWEWNGTRWNRIFTPNSPSARQRHAMAFDSARGLTILFGGRDSSNTYLNDTWTYDGSNWTQVAIQAPPQTRWNHSLAYDAARQQVVLTGGGNNAGRHNDTWVFDGAVWTQKAPATQLPQIEGHGTAYDAARQVVVLYGANLTYEWNGTTWTRINTSDVPIPDDSFGMAYDSGVQRVVLFGGWDPGTGRRGEVYEFTGLNWVTRTVSGAVPVAQYLNAMVYDSARGQMVLFGGNDNNGARLNRTWLLTGGVWSEPFQVDVTPTLDMQTKPNGIWNFTTVDVPAGFTLTFLKNEANTPVIWLCTGDVNISGTVALDGAAGGGGSVDPGNERAGGPGGFAGGLGGRRRDVSGSYAGSPGQGPGGGLPGTDPSEARDGGNAGHAQAGGGTRGGKAYGSILSNPVTGGSGGGGGCSTETGSGSNGGGGGGAILIASSGNITVNGRISATGGAGVWNGVSTGGSGSGGTIRLVANRIQGSGALDARDRGRIRTEAFFVQLTGQINPLNTAAPPIAVQLGNLGTIRITEVAGKVVPLNPTGNTNAPDVVFTEAGPITISLATTNIPQGTTIKVRITASGSVIETDSTPVTANGSATATATVPAGVGTIQAFADYTVQ